jgi:hypothetical protein
MNKVFIMRKKNRMRETNARLQSDCPKSIF